MDNVTSMVEVPFQYRHCCWFCHEPASEYYSFPNSRQMVIHCSHESLSLNACQECHQMASKAHADTIWQVRSSVKKQLMKKYQKHLAIGLNWTQEELTDSQFEGGTFSGFQKSAWFVYEVARERVNFLGWPLYVGGIPIDFNDFDHNFSFDGVLYPSVEQAIDHYVITFKLSKELLIDVLDKVGVERFSYAIRFTRLLIGATPQECRLALADLS